MTWTTLVRPEGFVEPLFLPGTHSKEIAEHLTASGWLWKASETEADAAGQTSPERAPERNCHVLRSDEGVCLVRREGRGRATRWRKRRVRVVIEKWRDVRGWWEPGGDSGTDLLCYRVLASGGVVLELAYDRGSGGWRVAGVVDWGKPWPGMRPEASPRRSLTCTPAAASPTGWVRRLPSNWPKGRPRLGYGALALTERDGMYGIPRFLRACGQQELSPITGAEITVQPRKDGLSGHVVLLCESRWGYRSLCKLISAYRLPEDGAPWPPTEERRNPVCGLDTLLDHTDGLICLTGAIPFGLVPTLACSKNTDFRGKSREILALLREAFGAENVYVELTDDGTRGSRRRMREVEELAGQCGVSAVAAHEVTYLRPADHRLSEALAAANALSALPPPDSRPTDRLYLRSPTRMGKLFADRPRALANAAAVAERCAGAIRLSGEVLMPRANLREGEVSECKLMRLAVAGARELYPDSFGGVARPVKFIALTHLHPDHPTGAKRLSGICGAPVLAFGAGLEDREQISGLVALHTPGHAPDHLCFWDSESRTLL